MKESIRDINTLFSNPKFNEHRRHFTEILTFINQYQSDIDLLMCQMQYEPKVKETILFAPVTTDILDRLNLILHSVEVLAKEISSIQVDEQQTIEKNSNDIDSFAAPSKVAYLIKVKTNDQASSSLSDEIDVTLKLYGSHNKSADIRLIQSVNKKKWQPGQIDTFNIELNYLGDIYAIEICHSAEYSSWKVDWIDVIDDAANLYRFPIDRILDKNSNDNKSRFIIQRDLGPVPRIPTKPAKQVKSYNQIGFTTYKVQVKTGKQINRTTDASVFIQLQGVNGSFSGKKISIHGVIRA